jgi:RNA polymerase sigma-70 factor (ECF subfamily)
MIALTQSPLLELDSPDEATEEESPELQGSVTPLDHVPFRRSPRRVLGENEETDESLMTRVADGQQDALETLYDRQAGLIKSVIFRIIHNEAEAEDVVMEVFYEAWKGASKYSAVKGKALGWLVTMARRRAIDRLRKRQSYSRATDRFQVEVDHDPDAWVSGRDPDGDSERADIRSFIQAKLLELPPFQREAIEFAFFKGMSQREIAAHTGIPLGTIKTRIELALKKLSVSLEILGDDL